MTIILRCCWCPRIGSSKNELMNHLTDAHKWNVRAARNYVFAQYMIKYKAPFSKRNRAKK